MENNLAVKFKKLHPLAKLPTYATPGDAGMDLYATEVHNEEDTPYIEYSTGLAVEIPEGYVGLIFPRSSISKKPQWLANAVAVIDSGYRGEIKLRFKPTFWVLHSPSNTQYYSPGEKIAQMIIMPYPTIIPQWAEELSDTQRGEGGFGSTGK